MGVTASWYQLAPAMTFAKSVTEFPTSSLMFWAAWRTVCDPGLPETELAAPRTSHCARRRDEVEGAHRGRGRESLGEERMREVENERLRTRGARPSVNGDRSMMDSRGRGIRVQGS